MRCISLLRRPGQVCIFLCPLGYLHRLYMQLCRPQTLQLVQSDHASKTKVHTPPVSYTLHASLVCIYMINMFKVKNTVFCLKVQWRIPYILHKTCETALSSFPDYQVSWVWIKHQNWGKAFFHQNFQTHWLTRYQVLVWSNFSELYVMKLNQGKGNIGLEWMLSTVWSPIYFWLLYPSEKV